jgi:hypothetical protein
MEFFEVGAESGRRKAVANENRMRLADSFAPRHYDPLCPDCASPARQIRK